MTTSAHSVKILPKLQIPEEYVIRDEFDERKVVPVLLFNPAPCEVSYVSEAKTSIKVAFTGDEFYGMQIFTASTFVSYADRMMREEEAKEKQLFFDNWL